MNENKILKSINNEFTYIFLYTLELFEFAHVQEKYLNLCYDLCQVLKEFLRRFSEEIKMLISIKALISLRTCPKREPMHVSVHLHTHTFLRTLHTRHARFLPFFKKKFTPSFSSHKIAEKKDLEI